MSELKVYNLRKEKYAHSLVASGVANRWNREKEYVIYTRSSRALSALELVVHKSSVDLGGAYKLLGIEIDATEDDIEIVKDLPPDWQNIAGYTTLQILGSQWYRPGRNYCSGCLRLLLIKNIIT